MRVLILAPWFRTLAHVHAQALEQRGHKVLVVSTPAHFQPGYQLAREVLLPADIRTHWLRRWGQTWRDIAQWRPEAALLDETWDLRHALLARRVPTALLVHDAAPHDAAHTAPWHHRQVRAWLRTSAGLTACFSEHVAGQLGRAGARNVCVVPLASELPDEDAPPPAPRRCDFLVLGRLSAYKNLPVLFRAWEAHLVSEAYAGDTLVVLGEGELDQPLPPRVRWDRRRFDLREEARSISRFKGSIAMYRAGSQSGVQILSQQLGVATIASTAGGLPEYQAPGLPSLDPDDVRGLTRALGLLADEVAAVRLGRAARVTYESRSTPTHVGAALEGVLDRLVLGNGRR